LLDGPLYAVGGNDGWSFLNTVERWDPQFRSWNFVAPMNTPRSTHGVVAFDSKIFAVGGRDVSSCLRSVECFDTHFNRWTQMANLNKRRGMPGVAVFQDCIFAVGGHDTPGKALIKILDTFSASLS
jgi:kelch-like protein 1/4/5